MHGIWNTQTTHNGGGVRPALSWKIGEPIEWVRKTTPKEAVRIASLPDDYLSFIKQFDDSDAFKYQCINMGVPICTSRDLCESIHCMLDKCDIPKSAKPDFAEHFKCNYASETKHVIPRKHRDTDGATIEIPAAQVSDASRPPGSHAYNVRTRSQYNAK